MILQDEELGFLKSVLLMNCHLATRIRTACIFCICKNDAFANDKKQRHLECGVQEKSTTESQVLWGAQT